MLIVQWNTLSKLVVQKCSAEHSSKNTGLAACYAKMRRLQVVGNRDTNFNRGPRQSWKFIFALIGARAGVHN